MQTKEEWRACSVPGYEVSSLGGVRHAKTGAFITQSHTTGGYLRVWLSGRHYRVHVLVLEAWVPRPSERHIPNHLDLDKQNNAVHNLQWATIRENTLHALHAGAYHPHRKLDRYRAWVIRLRWALGDCIKRLADEYDVTPTTIRFIVKGKIWVDC